MGQVASLSDHCTFCKLVQEAQADDVNLDGEKSSGRALYKDEHCVIFEDIRKDRCTAHYQCIPTRHIRDYTQLRLSFINDQYDSRCPDLDLLMHM